MTTPPFDPDFVALLREGLAPDAAIGADTDLRAAGLTSMGAIEMLIRVEARYAIKIPDNQLNGTTFSTPGALWEVVSAQLAAA